MNAIAENTVRVCCVADLHGHLPELPAHHLLLIAGDLCPGNNHDLAFQRDFITKQVVPWLEEEASNPVVVGQSRLDRAEGNGPIASPVSRLSRTRRSD